MIRFILPIIPLLLAFSSGDQWAKRNPNAGGKLFIFPGIASDPSIADMQISSNMTIGATEYQFTPATNIASTFTLTVTGVLITYSVSGAGTLAGAGTVVGM